MRCQLQQALRALDRGHVTWEQLHPDVREKLEWEVRNAQARYGAKPRVEHQRALQHGRKW